MKQFYIKPISIVANLDFSSSVLQGSPENVGIPVDPDPEQEEAGASEYHINSNIWEEDNAFDTH